MSSLITRRYNDLFCPNSCKNKFDRLSTSPCLDRMFSPFFRVQATNYVRINIKENYLQVMHVPDDSRNVQERFIYADTGQ